jgi:hypothetical protein
LRHAKLVEAVGAALGAPKLAPLHQLGNLAFHVLRLLLRVQRWTLLSLCLERLLWQLAEIILEGLGVPTAEELLSGSCQLVLQADEAHGLLEGALRRFRQYVASVDVSAEVVQATQRVFEGFKRLGFFRLRLKESDEALRSTLAGETALMHRGEARELEGRLLLLDAVLA